MTSPESIKGPLLKDIPEIPQEWSEGLKSVGIVSLEQFYARWQIGKEGLIEVLSISPEQAEQLPEIAKKYLGEEKVSQMDAFAPVERPLGYKLPWT